MRGAWILHHFQIMTRAAYQDKDHEEEKLAHPMFEADKGLSRRFAQKLIVFGTTEADDSVGKGGNAKSRKASNQSKASRKVSTSISTTDGAIVAKADITAAFAR
jgi:hypothetical protein